MKMTTFKQFLISEIKNSTNINPGSSEVADKIPRSEFQANIEMASDKNKNKDKEKDKMDKVLGPKNLSPAERARAEARKKKKGFFGRVGDIVAKVVGGKS